MRRIRDVFYINANFEENYFAYYGMEFSEFIKFNPIPVENILMLDPSYLCDPMNTKMYMSTMNKEMIADVAENEDVYRLGNFHWMDYRDEEALARCPEQKKAEVLYLSHFLKPLVTPFFDELGNHYVYLAHDDGWYCRLYCKDMSLFGDIIANKIESFFSTNKRRKIYKIGEDVKKQFLEWAKDGLLIDFSGATSSRINCGLSVYCIGKFENMDDMYHDLNMRIEFASKNGWIEHKNKVWKMSFWERKQG